MEKDAYKIGRFGAPSSIADRYIWIIGNLVLRNDKIRKVWAKQWTKKHSVYFWNQYIFFFFNFHRASRGIHFIYTTWTSLYYNSLLHTNKRSGAARRALFTDQSTARNWLVQRLTLLITAFIFTCHLADWSIKMPANDGFTSFYTIWMSAKKMIFNIHNYNLWFLLFILYTFFRLFLSWEARRGSEEFFFRLRGFEREGVGGGGAVPLCTSSYKQDLGSRTYLLNYLTNF